MSNMESRKTISKEQLLESDGDDWRFRKMLYDFFAFSESLAQIRSLFATCIGLSPTQYQILIIVNHNQSNGNTVGVAHVAEELRLSGTLITTETNKLAKLELLEKQPHPNDKRRVQLKITHQGLERLEGLASVQRPINNALFDSLSRDDFEALSRILHNLAQSGSQAIHLAHHLIERKLRP